ncbi:MazG nucleotide pyrophosphohydrolase domain-containing protein [Microbacterium sp. YY-03]|uniref:MazG nucleotide pyrophosphohydrolase domain-containing protein n=1 Tax=Microbacterium sp. YY-03 TaxID=3421636 RepID=UPI003D16A130
MTHEALLPYLIEEAHELVDAVERGSDDDLREELGDVLWQVLFHSEIASREGRFSIDDVAGELADKMTRRHPHVFAGETAETPEQVLVLWNAAKAAEKRERRSVLDGVARSMPALAYAQKVLGKASSVGVEAPVLPLALETEEDLGVALLALAGLARERGLDAEALLRAEVRRVEARVRDAESSSGR